MTDYERRVMRRAEFFWSEARAALLLGRQELAEHYDRRARQVASEFRNVPVVRRVA